MAIAAPRLFSLAGRRAVPAAVERKKTDRITRFDAACAGADRMYDACAVGAENARQAPVARRAAGAQRQIDAIDRGRLQFDDDVVFRSQRGLVAVFVAQLFDAAVGVNAYRFQGEARENTIPYQEPSGESKKPRRSIASSVLLG
jgi:hypothetical protein